VVIIQIHLMDQIITKPSWEVEKAVYNVIMIHS